MANIVPSILTDDITEAQRQLKILETFSERVQIDIMDGQFVNSHSITADDIRLLNASIDLEVHLMVEDPMAWLPYLDPKIFKLVYFHIEAMPEPGDLIKKIRGRDFEVGLAVKIATPLLAIDPYVEMVDSVLFMSVVPGRQGQEFHSEVLAKIRKFSGQYPDHNLAIDGGINSSNIEEVLAAGVDDVGVGSAISQSRDPQEAYLKLKDKLI